MTDISGQVLLHDLDVDPEIRWTVHTFSGQRRGISTVAFGKLNIQETSSEINFGRLFRVDCTIWKIVVGNLTDGENVFEVESFRLNELCNSKMTEEMVKNLKMKSMKYNEEN